ncbi:hypothetical protein GCM10027039_38320 [Terrabacter koreensis]
MRGLTMVLTFLVALGIFSIVQAKGWLTPLGIGSSSNDSQVVQAIERTQEVSLLRLGIQGIKEERRNREIFGQTVPGTGEKLFLQYAFKAKLGVDGAKIKVTTVAPGKYVISVPEFIFIGYDQPTFMVAVEDNDVLSWVTPDIDQMQMVNKVLNDGARRQYLVDNDDLLREQTKVFYDGLIKSVDPDAVTEFQFRS